MHKIGSICYDTSWSRLVVINDVSVRAFEWWLTVTSLKTKDIAQTKITDLIPMTPLDLYLLTGKGTN